MRAGVFSNQNPECWPASALRESKLILPHQIENTTVLLSSFPMKDGLAFAHRLDDAGGDGQPMQQEHVWSPVPTSSAMMLILSGLIWRALPCGWHTTHKDVTTLAGMRLCCGYAAVMLFPVHGDWLTHLPFNKT